MSQQHAQFEEESRGEPSYQIGYSTRDELPLLSYDHVDLPSQKLQAGSPGTAKSTPNLNYLRFALALISLIFVFVLMVLAITVHTDSASFIHFPFVIIHTDSVSFTNFFFVVLFAVLAIFLNLILAFQRNASPRKARKPED